MRLKELRQRLFSALTMGKKNKAEKLNKKILKKSLKGKKTQWAD